MNEDNGIMDFEELPDPIRMGMYNDLIKFIEQNPEWKDKKNKYCLINDLFGIFVTDDDFFTLFFKIKGDEKSHFGVKFSKVEPLKEQFGLS